MEVTNEGSMLLAYIVALQAVIYTYDGWSAGIYFSEEVKDHGRNIPRSMLSGVLSVTIIYLLINVAFLAVVALPTIAGSKFAAGVVVQRMFGAAGENLLYGLVVLILLSAVSSNVLMAPRVIYAMALSPTADAQGQRLLAVAVERLDVIEGHTEGMHGQLGRIDMNTTDLDGHTERLADNTDRLVRIASPFERGVGRGLFRRRANGAGEATGAAD